jgi:hypothetical protein
MKGEVVWDEQAVVAEATHIPVGDILVDALAEDIM